MAWCESNGLPKPELQHKFFASRRWRFDYCWPAWRVALEVEGGAFKKDGGRHTRGAGFRKDIEKYNAAVLEGWGTVPCPSRTTVPYVNAGHFEGGVE